MKVKHYCPFCKKLIRVEILTDENRKIAKTAKENMKMINEILGKSCKFIHI